jgi:hypothetical protein
VLAIVLMLVQTGCKDDPKAECGNNRMEDEEVCDGSDFGGTTCQTFGYFGGTLTCSACATIGEMSCTGGCGNNRAEGAEVGLAVAEECDGTDVRGLNCNTAGFELGTVTCNNDCSALDIGDCYDPSCGDEVIEGHEQCEPGLPLATTCVGRGFNEGDLACHGTGAGDDACMYDESDCVAWICGNDVVEGLEQCDGTDLGDADDCTYLGYDEGELTCIAAEEENECRWDDSACVNWVCGDGSVDGDEDCEPTVAITDGCADVGFASGTLDCTAVADPDECTYDLSGCVDGCGNDTVEGSEVCDGDDLDGQDCTTVPGTFIGGDLLCLPDCTAFETSGCISA